MIDQKIAERCAAAKLRLRFDRVAQRLVRAVKAALEDSVRSGEAVIFTVTAPIKLPAKTIAALIGLIRKGSNGGDVHGNQIQIRRVTGVLTGRPRVLGFVHNPESAADLILDLVVPLLMATDLPQRSREAEKPQN